MNLMRDLARWILDVFVAAIGLYLIWWGISMVRDVIRELRWHTEYVPPDPVAIEKWAVLAEARKITQEAAGDA